MNFKNFRATIQVLLQSQKRESCHGQGDPGPVDLRGSSSSGLGKADL